jgi:hypothetical protein
MDVKAKRDFSSPTFGYVNEGQVIPNVDKAVAESLLEAGVIESYDTKVIEQTPLPAKRKARANKRNDASG